MRTGACSTSCSGAGNKAAAEGLLHKLLKKQMRPPRVMITDRLASYAAAKKTILPGVEHRQHKGLNNRAEKLAPADTTTRTRGVFSPPMAGSTTSFISAAITFPLTSIDPSRAQALQTWAAITGVAGVA